MEELKINPNRIELDEAYMQMAEIWAKRSKGVRLQVGALIVKDTQIISDGYNGMPAGDPNDVCEFWAFPEGYDGTDGVGGPPDKELRTKPEVLHAESNALMKITKNGGVGAEGATLYTTYSPCFECAKLIKQAKITRVVFRNVYRDLGGIIMLQDRGVVVEQLTPSVQHRMASFSAEAARAPIPEPEVVVPEPPKLIPKSEPTRIAKPSEWTPPPEPVREILEEPPMIPIVTPPLPSQAELDAQANALLAEYASTFEKPTVVPGKAAAPVEDDGAYKSSFL